jgi:hypothetical protein
MAAKAKRIEFIIVISDLPLALQQTLRSAVIEKIVKPTIRLRSRNFRYWKP